jgi:predicted DNA-binding protein with PD1-like motif
VPAADGRPNSDAVADVYAISGQFARVLVLRLKYQTDLLAGLENIAKEQKICNADILAGADRSGTITFTSSATARFLPGTSS